MQGVCVCGKLGMRGHYVSGFTANPLRRLTGLYRRGEIGPLLRRSTVARKPATVDAPANDAS